MRIFQIVANGKNTDNPETLQKFHWLSEKQHPVHEKSKQTDLCKSQYPRVMVTHQINRMKYQNIKAGFYQRKKKKKISILEVEELEAMYSEMLKKSFHFQQYTEETGEALSLNFSF